MNDLGKKCYFMCVAVKGDTDKAACQKVIANIIAAVGMTPIFDPACWEYGGDVGRIYAQPIYESIMLYDAWPKHRGGYLVVTSCREYHPGDVLKTIEDNGFDICDFKFNILSL